MHAHAPRLGEASSASGLALLLALVTACGEAKPTTSTSMPTPGGQGRLSVELVDAPVAGVSQIWVNVERVTAHSTSAGWVTLSTTPFSVDLLTLQQQAAAIGFAHLLPGTVTEVRLVVSDQGNSVTVNGAQFPLAVPSGAQSGIKIKGPWEITACGDTTLTLDFDGPASLMTHPSQQGAVWILRPVIRLKRVATTPVGCGTDGGSPPGGVTPPAGTDALCTEAVECRSGMCVESRCAPGGPGTPCLADLDCVATCTEQTGLCGGTGGTPGTPCTTPADCNSASCDGQCAPGGQGTPCAADTECQEGLICPDGTCAPARSL